MTKTLIFPNLSLKKRGLYYVITAISLQLMLCIITAVFIERKTIDKNETLLFEQTANRVRHAVFDDLQQIKATTNDYMLWSETSSFVRNGSTDYPQDNFTRESMSNIGINLCMIVDMDGKILLEKNYDKASGTFKKMPGSIEQLVKSLIPSDNRNLGAYEKSDVANLPEGVLLFTFRTIHSSTKLTSAPCGFGFMATWLDKQKLDDYKRLTGIELKIKSELEDDPTNGLKIEAIDAPKTSDPICFQKKISGKETEIIITFLNSEEKKTFQLISNQFRFIHIQSRDSYISLISLMIIINIIVGLGFIRSINKDVLNRIIKLDTEVQTADLSNGKAIEIKDYGIDEIGNLSKSITDLMLRIKTSTEDALTHKERMRLLMAKSPLLISVSDIESGKLYYVNESFITLTNKQILKYQTLDKMIDGFIPDPQRQKELRREFAHRCNEAEVHSYATKPISYTLHLENGRKLDVEDYIAVSKGNVYHIAFDSTERNLTLLKLKEALKAKGQFLANVSHEIRTPLNGIVGMVQFLSETDVNSEQKECIETISESCDLLVTIINDILDISKLESGTMTISEAPVPLRPMISSVMELIGSRILAKDLDFTCKLADDLPFGVICDQNRIKQIILNLLSNALKFTQEGGISLNVAFEKTEKDKGILSFAVKDTGLGIAPEHRERIYKPFEQIDSTHTRNFSGIGLGLSICLHFVKLMKGQMDLKSEENVGSTFSFKIPVTTISEETIETKKTIESNPHREQKLHLSILSVDDNDVNQRVVAMMLRKMGGTVDFASNGQQAVNMAKTNDYDVILMDIQMPIMDGFEASQAILSNTSSNKKPNIIALTAHARPEDAEACEKAGMYTHLTKPLKKTELFNVLSEIESSKVK